MVQACCRHRLGDNVNATCESPILPLTSASPVEGKDSDIFDCDHQPISLHSRHSLNVDAARHRRPAAFSSGRDNHRGRRRRARQAMPCQKDGLPRPGCIVRQDSDHLRVGAHQRDRRGSTMKAAARSGDGGVDSESPCLPGAHAGGSASPSPNRFFVDVPNVMSGNSQVASKAPATDDANLLRPFRLAGSLMVLCLGDSASNE